ncbi:hypothetical protein VEE73_31700 [Escherichia coli]|nr:hypothetical protein VEE73_31700 [Escherichia coli]
MLQGRFYSYNYNLNYPNFYDYTLIRYDVGTENNIGYHFRYFSANSSPQDLGVQSVADRANLGSITSFFASNPH